MESISTLDNVIQGSGCKCLQHFKNSLLDGGLNFRHAQQHFDQLVGGQDMVKQYSNFLFSMT